MTISYKSFDKVVGTDRIVAWWNNVGTIGIDQRIDGFKMFQEGSNNRHIALKPLEIETLIKDNKFEYDGVRPGLFPCIEKIEAYIVDGIVTIKGGSYSKPVLSFPKTILEEIFISTKKIWEKKRETVRPFIGLNCKAGSFDAMEGKLDQDKINEEQRAVVKNFLDSDPKYQIAKIRIQKGLKKLLSLPPEERTPEKIRELLKN